MFPTKNNEFLKIIKMLYESPVKTMNSEDLRGSHTQALGCAFLYPLFLIPMLKI